MRPRAGKNFLRLNKKRKKLCLGPIWTRVWCVDPHETTCCNWSRGVCSSWITLVKSTNTIITVYLYTSVQASPYSHIILCRYCCWQTSAGITCWIHFFSRFQEIMKELDGCADRSPIHEDSKFGAKCVRRIYWISNFGENLPTLQTPQKIETTKTLFFFSIYHRNDSTSVNLKFFTSGLGRRKIYTAQRSSSKRINGWSLQICLNTMDLLRCLSGFIDHVSSQCLISLASGDRRADNSTVMVPTTKRAQNKSF